MSKQVIIAGGGIIGLCSAYYLHKEGHKVTVIDKSAMNSGASYVNAGYIRPSHFTPLASPGVIAQGLKWMFNSSSPFYMKPRLDPAFLTWGWYFKKSSTEAKVKQAVPLLRDINVLSQSLFEEIHRSGDLGAFHLEHNGLLILFKTDKAAEKELKLLKLAHKAGLEAELLSAEAVRNMEPGLAPGVKGAIYYKCDAHSSPDQIMGNLKQYLAGQGVIIKPEEEITRFKRQGNGISGVITDKAEYPADEVVIAAGSWTAGMARLAGLKLSLQAGKGYRINVERPLEIVMPAVLAEAKVAVTPMQGFTRFAGTMEFSGINHKIRKERVQAIAGAASEYYNDLKIEQREMNAAQCGLRPVSPDGLPYIGRISTLKNLSIATGHAMMGWGLGPVTGKLISELVSGKKLSLNIDAYHPERRF